MGSISIPTAAAVGEGAADAAAADAAAAATAASVAASTAGAATLSTTVTAADLAGTAGAAAAAGSTAGLGAGGSIFTLANATTAAGLLGSGGSAFEQHKAGVAQANDAAAKSRQAGLEAGQKQINIRQNMLKALASQNAAAGAAGIGTGGSFGANVKRQITQNQNDLMALSADTSSEQQQYGLQGSNARTAANVKAGASLLDAGMSAANGFS
jgi:hypothetical protein